MFSLWCLLLCMYHPVFEALYTLWELWYKCSRSSRHCLCDSHERCCCACVGLCAFVCHPVCDLDDSDPHFLLISKASAQYSSGANFPVKFATLIYIGTPVFPLFNLRNPRGFKSTTSRRGAHQLHLRNIFAGIFFEKCSIKCRKIRPSSTNETRVVQGFCWDKRR